MAHHAFSLTSRRTSCLIPPGRPIFGSPPAANPPLLKMRRMQECTNAGMRRLCAFLHLCIPAFLHFMKNLLIATTNPHKILEIRTLLGGLPFELCTLADWPDVTAPE